MSRDGFEGSFSASGFFYSRPAIFLKRLTAALFLAAVAAPSRSLPSPGTALALLQGRRALPPPDD